MLLLTLITLIVMKQLKFVYVFISQIISHILVSLILVAFEVYTNYPHFVDEKIEANNLKYLLEFFKPVRNSL